MTTYLNPPPGPYLPATKEDRQRAAEYARSLVDEVTHNGWYVMNFIEKGKWDHHPFVQKEAQKRLRDKLGLIRLIDGRIGQALEEFRLEQKRLTEKTAANAYMKEHGRLTGHRPVGRHR